MQSETETKPKATKGRRGRKTTSRKKASPKASSESASEAGSPVQVLEPEQTVKEDDKQVGSFQVGLFQ